MDSCQEVLIVASNNISMFDAVNGNLLYKYTKDLAFCEKTLTVIDKDYIFGAINKKPTVKAITMGTRRKAIEAGDLVIPGNASAMAATSCGIYLFVAIGKELYIWKAPTGNLLAVVECHYQDISCIKVSSDDTYVITGGKDGHVRVWMLYQLIEQDSNPSPRFDWQAHSKDVTDIYISPQNTYGHVISSSLDSSIKIYNLGYGNLVSTIYVDTPLTAVVADPLRNFVFTGDVSGGVWRIDIQGKFPKEKHIERESNYRSLDHKNKIVSLDVNFDGTKLITSSEGGFVIIYEMTTFDKVLNFKTDGKISNMVYTLIPTGFFARDISPNFKIRSLKRNFQENEDMDYMYPGEVTITLHEIFDFEDTMEYVPNPTFADTPTSAFAYPQRALSEAEVEEANAMVQTNKHLYTMATAFLVDALCPNKEV